MTDETRNSALYPISTVASMTGVNPVTLRAWERRYGLIQPTRTGKGHRLYSAQDVERIKEVLRLVEEGIPIGQVPQVLEAGAHVPGELVSAGEGWADYQERMVSAIEQFNEAGLESVYNEALSLYPVDIVTRRLLVPLLKELGERWENATGSVAEEHFFGVYMRNKLGARFHHRQGNPQGPKLLAACLPGEQHEIGILLFALAAHDRGFRIVLLGADMPLEELPIVVRRAKCDAIVLSGAIEPSETVLKKQLPDLVQAARVPVFIGGITARLHSDEITSAGARPVGNDLVLGLRDINSALNTLNP
ncbi:MAG: MerR family transcriptional regulator [Acidiferrobacterales bacterium]